MNADQVDAICTAFKLGSPIGTPTKVQGGLLHSMWKLHTETGFYAVKELSCDIPVTPQVRRNYELTEQIALALKTQCIPAVSALRREGQHIFDCNGNTFLVYPWVDATTLPSETISAIHAEQIADILARMHKTNIRIPELSAPYFDIRTQEEISDLIAQSISRTLPFAQTLQQHKELLLQSNDLYRKSIPLLQSSHCISHGDLDQKNVLWDKNGKPIIIDWESARNLNPTQEIINVALDWSGITSDAFDLSVFTRTISTYLHAGGVIELRLADAAFAGILGNWINWMFFNVQRCIKNATQNAHDFQASVEQVDRTMQTIMRIEKNMPALIKEITKKL